MSDSFTIEPTGYQARMLEVPENYDVLECGGRGGGKSYALGFAILRHIETHSAKARVLFVRKSYSGLRDFEMVLRELFGAAYGTRATFNSQEHLWRLPNGATVELNQVEGPADLHKFQGRSFTLLCADEVGQYSDPADLEVLRSNLRGPREIPLRVIWSCNPGGSGHAWIWKRFVSKATPWRPFVDEKSGRTWVIAPSTLDDNPHVDREDYKRQLEAATSHDPELRRAWIAGDWNIARGAFFGHVLDVEKVAVDPRAWSPQPVFRLTTTRLDGMTDEEIATLDPPDGWTPEPRRFTPYLSVDFGSSAPSVCLLMLRSAGAKGPDDFYYPRGSIVVVDEWVHCRPDRLNEGLGYTVPRQAEEILAMCRRWGAPAVGVGDDAMFSRARGNDAATIADEFAQERVTLRPARKGDRITGWVRLKKLLAAAGTTEPGLYISKRCEYTWSTLPFLERDPRRPEDMASDGPDHAADALRYGCMPEARSATVSHVDGWF